MLIRIYIASGLDLRSIRVFRLFRLVRILKLFKYKQAYAEAPTETVYLTLNVDDVIPTKLIKYQDM
ncbi:protein of unknown function [Moritella yayanosii]|uniref:Uncharacterized protein n=1 Tax=Moritella yayanosii TaxID=69539 RepID=A0A330LWT2_9GAMM|nr:protein of unknown function [Moritella yayanosii]